MAQTQTRRRTGGGPSRNGSRPSPGTVERLRARASHAADSLAPAGKPAMAAGAALAGLATGVALASRGQNRLGEVAFSARPLAGREGTSKTLLRTTRELHATACALNDMVSEVRQLRELAQAARNRSPIEVVLQGLTRRPER